MLRGDGRVSTMVNTTCTLIKERKERRNKGWRRKECEHPGRKQHRQLDSFMVSAGLCPRTHPPLSHRNRNGDWRHHGPLVPIRACLFPSRPCLDSTCLYIVMKRWQPRTGSRRQQTPARGQIHIGARTSRLSLQRRIHRRGERQSLPMNAPSYTRGSADIAPLKHAL